MPTGYTRAIQDGTITEFRDFALQCARAFGALIDMRDDPHDAAIPDEIEPSSWYAERLAKAQADLAELDRMGDDEVVSACRAHNEEQMAAYQDHLRCITTSMERYNTMLSKARAWQPPTPDHQGMKDFMIEQLTSSIQHDCSWRPEAPKAQTPTEWLNWRREELKRNVEYYREHDAKEIECAASTTAWIKALRASL